MEPIESEGRTVKEAVDSALSKCGLRRDQVEITVIQEGSTGFMGMGAKPAKVRLTEKRWGPDSPAPSQRSVEGALPRVNARARPPEPRRAPAPKPAPAPQRAAAPIRAVEPVRAPRPARADSSAPPKPLSAAEAAENCGRSQALVLELLKLMGIAAPTATSSWDADLERVKITIESQDAPLLVGRDGRVLESLQFLATLMLSRGATAPLAVQIDALAYWEKREQAVLDAARAAAETVKATGKPVRMEPMDSSMRRLVHRTLSNSADVTTASEGEGAWRKLVIRPRAK
ncbi:MAG: RNA-binding cell elongation regulator Jag/EloR [Elusimicrobiota bacterium]|nr:RNA-binding cell elongation regulator Jag/EloR [Elusimicrobiota bacterium]